MILEISGNRERTGESIPGRGAVATREHQREAERSLKLQFYGGPALCVFELGKRAGAPGAAFEQMRQVLEDGRAGGGEANSDLEIAIAAEAPVERTPDVAELLSQRARILEPILIGRGNRLELFEEKAGMAARDRDIPIVAPRL